MTSAALRPRSPSEIVDAAFQILRAHYALFVMCAAIAYVPLLVLRLLLIGDPRRIMEGGPTQVPLFTWRYFLVGGTSIITFVLMGAVLVTLTSQAYLGETVDAGEAVRRVWRRLPGVFLASVASTIAIGIGLMLLLVPGLYLTARYFAVNTVLLLEDASVGTAFKRSATLSDGRKRHILNTLGLAFLIYYVLILGITMVSLLLGGFVLQQVISTVGVILIYPMVGITNVLLYYDARIQGEGLDVELMADALSPARASA